MSFWRSKELKPIGYPRTYDLLEFWLQRAAEDPQAVQVTQLDDKRWIVNIEHGDRRKTDLQKS